MRDSEAENSQPLRLLRFPGWLSTPPGRIAIVIGTTVVLAKCIAMALPAHIETVAPVFPAATVISSILALVYILRASRSAAAAAELRRPFLCIGSALLVVSFAAAFHLTAEIALPRWDPVAHEFRLVAGLMGIGVLCAAIALLPQKALDRGGWIAAGLDIATVLLTGFLAFWLYSLSPGIRDERLPLLQTGLIVTHTILTLGLLSLLPLVFLRRHESLSHNVISPITAGVILLIATEIVPTCHSLGIDAFPEEPMFFGWTLFALSIAVGFRAVAQKKEEHPGGQRRNTLVALPFAATGLVGLLLVTSIINRDIWIENASILLPSVFLALVLVVVRQTRIAHEKLRMAQEMQSAKEIAETANSSRLQFLANISHDLRTPLNGILGCAQILLRDKDINPKQRELLKTSQSCAEHLRTLINDLLDLSKLESGRLELAPTAFDLHAFLTELIGSFHLAAENKNIILELEPHAAPPRWITCDRRRLHQILGNLIHNAIKFTVRGAVTVKASGATGTLTFAIKDTGCGILPDKLDDLFKPFHVVDEKSIQLEGTGLGLSISKKLAETMGGDITVSSVYGKGSVFTVQLPLIEAAPVVEVQRTIVDYHGHRRRILIVDDKAENRVILRSIIEPLDFLVMEAGGGAEALERLQFAKPDVLILDLMMPEMDGFELCRRVRALNLPTAPVCIALSAMAGEDVYDRCRAAGFADWVRKPLNFEMLLESLHVHAGIEWVYGLIKPGPKNSVPLERETGPLKAPAPETLLVLTDIARRGNIRIFETRLAETVARDPSLAPFQTKAQQYLSEFKIKELADWLESLSTELAQ